MSQVKTLQDLTQEELKKIKVRHDKEIAAEERKKTKTLKDFVNGYVPLKLSSQKDLDKGKIYIYRARGDPKPSKYTTDKTRAFQVADIQEVIDAVKSSPLKKWVLVYRDGSARHKTGTGKELEYIGGDKSIVLEELKREAGKIHSRVGTSKLTTGTTTDDLDITTPAAEGAAAGAAKPAGEEEDSEAEEEAAVGAEEAKEDEAAAPAEPPAAPPAEPPAEPPVEEPEGKGTEDVGEGAEPPSAPPAEPPAEPPEGDGDGAIPREGEDLSEDQAKKALKRNPEADVNPALIGPDSAEEMKGLIYKDAFSLIFSDRSGVRELEQFKKTNENKEGERKPSAMLYQEAEEIREGYKDQLKVVKLVFSVADEKKYLLQQWQEMNTLKKGAIQNITAGKSANPLNNYDSIGLVVDISSLGISLDDFLQFAEKAGLSATSGEGGPTKNTTKLSGFRKPVDLSDVAPKKEDEEEQDVKPMSEETAEEDKKEKSQVIGAPEYITNKRPVRGVLVNEGMRTKKHKEKKVKLYL